MKQAPTLFDTLYRASFKNSPVNGWSNNAQWRSLITGARRFVLDDQMSTFLGELSTQAFTIETNKNLEVRTRLVENLRVGARLPHATTWIEYNLRECQTRSQQLLGQLYNPMETPKYEGWLLQQHPHLETAFIAHIITHDPDTDHGDGFDTWTFPIALAWTTDQDTVLPWRISPALGLSTHSEIATGLIGYKTDRASYVMSNLVSTPKNPKAIAHLVHEWCGVLRRMFAFLSTINDLPVLVSEVRQAKGFVARGQYRKFLDHKTLTLTVPQTHYLKVARNALAMAHRRGGPVRGHFRQDWRHLPSMLCEHEWIGVDEKHLECAICKGRKIWIADHCRGDSSRGFTTIDYKVTHDPT